MLKFSFGLVTILVLLFIPNQLFSGSQTTSETDSVSAAVPELNKAAPAVLISPKVKSVLEETFCSSLVCGKSDWQQWVIISSEHPWEAEELRTISEILTAVIEPLNQLGYDGRALLSGYRFQRQHGEYIIGHEGRIAVVNHTAREITLADAAFKRLHGFYIIHELGHIVDRRTGRQLSAAFHSQAGSNQTTRMTAEGYWLNLAAREDLEEATADAFALWIMGTYDTGYRPVFAYTPLTADYDGIEVAMESSLDAIGP
jgi:hypothetical protein